MSHVPGHRNGGATPAEDFPSSLNETLGNEARASMKMPNSMALSFLYIKTFKQLYFFADQNHGVKRENYTDKLELRKII